MKTKTFTKPEVHFPTFPAIFLWIEADYNKVDTYEQFTDFIHKCMTVAETTSNEVKSAAYTRIANALFSSDTNISFESKNLEILANN